MAVDDYVKEILAQAGLHHDNVCRLLGFGHEKLVYFTKYCPGNALSHQLMTRRWRPTYAQHACTLRYLEPMLQTWGPPNR
eukprot:COSAG04_NODE_9431_length_865_cov_0.808094_2_plen_80_part_00